MQPGRHYLWRPNILQQGRVSVLENHPACVGEVTHKENSYPGEHAAIHRQAIVGRSPDRACRKPCRAGQWGTCKRRLLDGMVFDETGERIDPTHAVKKGTRYTLLCFELAYRPGQKEIVPAAGRIRPAIWKAS